MDIQPFSWKWLFFRTNDIWLDKSSESLLQVNKSNHFPNINKSGETALTHRATAKSLLDSLRLTGIYWRK